MKDAQKDLVDICMYKDLLKAIAAYDWHQAWCTVLSLKRDEDSEADDNIQRWVAQPSIRQFALAESERHDLGSNYP